MRTACVESIPGDYSASQGVHPQVARGGGDYPGDVWHYAGNKIVVAARAARFDAVDGPFAAFGGPGGYRRRCGHSSPIGYVGKWAIHPSPIALANEAYSPGVDEVDRARRLEKAHAAAERQWLGAVAVDGDMVDLASIRVLRNTIAKARLIGM